GLLAILGGIADIVARRADNLRETAAEGANDHLGVVHAERRLREVGNLGAGRKVERLRLYLVLHQADAARRLADRAGDLVMPLVTDEEDGVPLPGEADGFEVDLGDQGTGGVDGVELPGRGGGANGGCHAVRSVEHRRSGAD